MPPRCRYAAIAAFFADFADVASAYAIRCRCHRLTCRHAMPACRYYRRFRALSLRYYFAAITLILFDAAA